MPPSFPLEIEKYPIQNFKYNSKIFRLMQENNNTKKGISAIIYDKNGGLYFLILHRNTTWKGWEFPKGPMLDGETIQDTFKREIVEKTGVRKIEVKHKLEGQRRFKKDDVLHIYDVFLAKANMNTPVNLNKKGIYDTYIWTKEERVLEKLNWNNEKEVFKKALEILKH